MAEVWADGGDRTDLLHQVQDPPSVKQELEGEAQEEAGLFHTSSSSSSSASLSWQKLFIILIVEVVTERGLLSQSFI